MTNEAREAPKGASENTVDDSLTDEAGADRKSVV